ncbi:MAG: nucleotidyl transferase AbiEii/AbiGii toxin family protein [Peptococcaceae bacterium]|nr:nucleotidyl transferase AbiEii/AbiGii toxin family protein [Peptococcaceae bacterium]
MSIKVKIRNLAKKNNVSAQVILQNYMFERFLDRISKSNYKDKFILKGGMLIAAIVGIDSRSTMDMDATLRGYPLDQEKLVSAILEICSVNIDDDIHFSFKGIAPIRDDDEYGGYRVSIEGVLETIITPMQIDITTGDAITPKEILYSFKMMFEDRRIEIWAYNIETVLAEKYETILKRGVFNTRPRDYYDIFILFKTQPFNKEHLIMALKATAIHRNSLAVISKKNEIINTIENNIELQKMWEKYKKEYYYANEINFEDIIVVLKAIGEDLID